MKDILKPLLISQSTSLKLHAQSNVSMYVCVRALMFQVLKGMCAMDNQIFKRHLRSFYPLFTKLVCCEQVNHALFMKNDVVCICCEQLLMVGSQFRLRVISECNKRWQKRKHTKSC